MIIALKLKNFYSLREEVTLDFTVDPSIRSNGSGLTENLIEFSGDKFVNIIGLFGSNAAGKSNLIKAVKFCRQFILSSHLNNEGEKLEYEQFKFDDNRQSEFYIDFVTNSVEYEYSFVLSDGKIISEELYRYASKRRSRIFVRSNTYSYSFGKGVLRPREVAEATGDKTLFLSRASSMNREFAQIVYRFFLNEIVVGLDSVEFAKLKKEEFDKNKNAILKGLEVSDSDIVDIKMIENSNGQTMLQSFHKENPDIAFDFFNEESEGTKRLMNVLMVILSKAKEGATFFVDEFDLKLHLFLAEFVLNLIRATGKSQFVFTSHNPLLINMDHLRLEQVVIVNKSPDGNSEFTPLSDFVGLGKNTNFTMAYLLGRFDGVPYVGNVRQLLEEETDQL